MRRDFLGGIQVIGRAFLPFFLLLMLSSMSWAQSAAVQNGLAWLTGSQSTDGHWPGVETADYHATSEALRSLALLNPASPALTTGRGWLATQDSSPTDFLSRHIVADASAAIQVSEKVNDLLALRAPSGGWGGSLDFSETILDTSLALQALKAANYFDSTIINPALAYLTTTQNADGGWGFYPSTSSGQAGNASNIYMTAVVTATLQQFPQMTSIATAVSKATSYLLAQQNPDGGFGTPSTVYETALAFIALVGNGQSGAQQAAPLQNAVNYLAATQSANGSWNDDPYSTALALKALYLSENHPSPPPPPPPGGTITGTVADATTGQRLGSVAVVLESNRLISTMTDSAGNFTLSDLPAGAETVSFTLEGYKPSSATANVMVGTTVNLGTVQMVSRYSTGTVAGTISDPAGKPLAGVTVTVTGAWSGTATTGSDGSFLFTYVTPGEVTLTVSKAGYQTFTAAGTVYARTILSFFPRLSATQSQTTTGTLVGRVVDSVWGVPIDHLSGETGVTVTVSGITVEPDPNNRGYFEIKNLAPDTYQVTVGMNGCASQTFRVVIAPGVTTDLGTIRLVMSISKMTLTGKVTNATTGAPIQGAAVSVAGTMLTGRTDTSGTYAIADIEHPSEITIRVSAAGYTGKSFLARTQPFTQTLNVALTPRSSDQPTGAEINVAVQTGKPSYAKNDPIDLTATLRNDGGENYPTTLHVTVTDPAGTSVFAMTQELTLVTDAVIVQNLSLTLPMSAPGGTYQITAEARNASGQLLGSGTKSVNVATSRITVTPTLPVLATGANQVSFTLANTGTLAVSSCVLDLKLTDPDGEVVATATQAFALGLGESKDLPVTLILPPLKFGTYTLAYAQSDETIAGATIEVPLPNTLAITALYDDNSHRVRATAGLTVTLVNAGRFNLAPAGAGLPVTVSVPDAGYVETKTLLPVPAAGNTAGSVLLYQFPLPETLTSGLHPTTIAVALPSGSVFVQTAQLAILESLLTLSPLQKNAMAGETLNPAITNTGGVDTPVQYALRLLDAKAAEIAQTSGIETARAGETLVLGLGVPSGAVDGSYQMIATLLDQKTGKEQTVASPVSISGVRATLQAHTDKEEYLATEAVTALGSLTNSVTLLHDGNLHLQVTTTAGTRNQKTWTTQADFQQGVRNGVDTYGVNDWIVPDDNFDLTTIDSNKWYVNGNVTVRSGKAFVDSTVTEASLRSRWQLEGDFDIQVDYSSNNSVSTQGAQLTLYSDTFSYATVHNNSYTGDVGDIVVDGLQYYSDTHKYRSSGKLRLTRMGETIAGYYWNGSAWIELVHATSPRLKSPCTVALRVWRWQSRPIGASAEYDNFKINSGRLKTENQTLGSVRLLPLNDNFDDGLVNWDRWNNWGSVAVSEADGVAHLTSSATSPVHGLTLRPSLSGDFSAVSTYRNYASTPSKALQGRYIMSADAGASGYYIQRASFDLSRGGGEVLVSLSQINLDYQMTSDLPYTSDRGEFRLRRVGTTGNTDYWDGSQWVTQHSRSGISSAPALIQLYTYSQIDMPTIRVDLDTFSVANRIYAGSGKILCKYDSGNDGTRWRELLHTNSQPSGTSIKFRTRTADTETALANALWSDYLSVSGSQVTNPPARWIEIEANLATTNTNVTPLLHDLTVTYDSDPGKILWETDVPADLAVSTVEEFNQVVGTLGVTGKLLLQAELTSSTGQEVATAEYPFYIEQGNMAVLLATDKKIYRPGETVTVIGEVRNRSSVAAAALTLRVENPGNLTVLYSEIFDLPAQGSRPFTFTTTAGADGIHALQAAVVQNNVTLAEVTEQYETASASLSATLTAPESVGGEAFAITVALKNDGKVEAAASVQVTDDQGGVGGTENVTIPAGETRLVQYSRQIVTDTLFTAVVSGGLNQTLTHKVAYAAPPSSSMVHAKIVVDRIAYDPNDPVTLTATIATDSLRENLSALVMITNGQGQALYTTSTALPLLNQGQLKTIDNYWNVGNHAAGSYFVTLQVLDAAGMVIGKSTCTLTIDSVSAPRKLLQGTLTLDRQTILTGEPITASLGVSNVGNTDLTDLILTSRVVDLEGQTVYQASTDPINLAMGATHSWHAPIDSHGYSAKDYIVLLLANMAGIEETLTGTYFRVAGAPTAPALAAPADGADVTTFTPTLAVSNAADPNDEELTYEFEIYEDGGLTTLAGAGTTVETAGTTRWTAALPLTENQTYHWRVRAYDGLLFGPWMAPASFRINTVDDPPSAPKVSSPAHDTSVAVLSPTLMVSNAIDPDSMVLTYNFDLSADPEFSQMVASATGIASGEAATSWTVPATLLENSWYYWRAQADDLLSAGPWMPTARFLVNTANDPPSVPTFVAPVDGATVPALTTDIVVCNSTDPDSPILSYYFEADTSASFDSIDLIRSGSVAEGQDTTTWTLSGLQDNSRYHLRVKANDGMAESAWSDVEFFANTANDPPSTPVLDNPSDGAGVTTFTPLLSVRNATDPDEDLLTYEFEVYTEAPLTNLVSRADGIAEMPQATAWKIPLALSENETYYWRARASDGLLHSDWMSAASFMVNTANDVPGAPHLLAPAEGMVLTTLTPTLTVVNAADPDSDRLTYDFEVYNGALLVAEVSGTPEGEAGQTSVTLGTALADNHSYVWRARAFDGERYGQWMVMASFSVHLRNTAIAVTIDFEPETLNTGSQGEWVKVEVEFPAGCKAADVDLSSLRLAGMVPADPRPVHIHSGKEGDRLTVKFKRSEVIAALPAGEKVPVRVTGEIASTPFEGVDFIRVIDR